MDDELWDTETLLSDGGTQYRRILLEAVNEYLDINGLRTTFHPQCNGTSTCRRKSRQQEFNVRLFNTFDN